MDDIDFDAIDEAVSQVMDKRQKTATQIRTKTAEEASKLRPVVGKKVDPQPVRTKISHFKPNNKSISDIKPVAAAKPPETIESIRQRRHERRRERVRTIGRPSSTKLMSDVRTAPAKTSATQTRVRTVAPKITKLTANNQPSANQSRHSESNYQPKVTKLVIPNHDKPKITQKTVKFSTSPSQKINQNGAIETKKVDGQYSSQTLTSPVSDKTTIKYHTSNLSYVERVDLDNQLIEADKQLIAGIKHLDDQDQLTVVKPVTRTRVMKPEKPTPAPEKVPLKKTKPELLVEPPKPNPADEIKISPFVDEVKVEKRPLGEPAKFSHAQLAEADFSPIPREKTQPDPVPLYSAENLVDASESYSTDKVSQVKFIVWLVLVLVMGVALGLIIFWFDLDKKLLSLF